MDGDDYQKKKSKNAKNSKTRCAEIRSVSAVERSEDPEFAEINDLIITKIIKWPISVDYRT